MVALVAIPLIAGCGVSGETVGRAAGLIEISGPYQSEPYRAFDQAVVSTIDEECAATNPGGRLELVLVDGRGGGKVLLLYDAPNGDSAECFARVDRNGNAFVDSTSSANDGGAAHAGPLEVQPLSGSSNGGADAWSYIHGRVGADIARVAIALPDGQQITASTGGGRFAAWWPDDAMSVRVLGYDAAGNEVYNQPF